MTNQEYTMLVQEIDRLGVDVGKVLKANGRWYVEGKKTTIPAPIIRLSYWVESPANGVIIEGRVIR